MLLLTKNVIDCKKYNEEYKKVTWEECSLRNWLNNDFYNTAFTDEEKKKILETYIVNDNNRELNTRGGNDTTDKIFLLSIDEAELLLNDKKRCKKTTHYAEKNGSYKSYFGNGWWWLRTSGYDRNSASIVDHFGRTFYYGCYERVPNGSVVCACWINLQ